MNKDSSAVFFGQVFDEQNFDLSLAEAIFSFEEAI